MFLLFSFFFFFFWFFGFFIFSYNYLRLLGFLYFSVFFLFSIFLLFMLHKGVFWYQLVLNFFTLAFLNVSYIIGVDGVSAFMVSLCSFLLFLCFLFYWNLRYKIRLYIFMLFLGLWVLFNVFLSLDFFFFYMFFEAIIVPLFFFIGVWGSRSRKIYASYQFFVYTLIGSIFVILSILSIFFSKGSSSFEIFSHSFFFEGRHFLLWLFLFLGFSIKIPILPFHIWLPEAHVEAPTPGSVILAGILLKLGTYAILRFLLHPFYATTYDLIFFILIISIFGLTYASLVSMTQIDIKKIIAYSSIAHMNFSLIGFFSQSFLGVAGAFFMMLGHAITASALFFGIGVLYDRYKTRLIFYYGGLVSFMPLFATLYFFFLLSNFGFPGTINFVGEFLISVGLFTVSNSFAFLSTLGLFLSLLYSLFFYNRVFFGPFFNGLRFYSDCTRLEFSILFPLVYFIVFFGLFPNDIFSLVQLSMKKLVFLFSNFS